MPDKHLLIIFVKNPVLGKVKTRLAQTIGNSKALDIYLQLLEHTSNVTSEISYDKVVYYSDYIDLSDIWPEKFYQKYLQQGSDLGERMQYAFAEAFAHSYTHVIIIGSDCPQLTSTHIYNAFDLLHTHSAVIGPAMDGGYYLLGMNQLIPDLFRDKLWSSDKVFSSTIADFTRLGLSFGQLEMLRDVDTAEDLQILKL